MQAKGSRLTVTQTRLRCVPATACGWHAAEHTCAGHKTPAANSETADVPSWDVFHLLSDIQASAQALQVTQRSQFEFKLARQTLQVCNWHQLSHGRPATLLAPVRLRLNVRSNSCRGACLLDAAAAVGVSTGHTDHRIVEGPEAGEARVVAFQRLLRAHLQCKRFAVAAAVRCSCKSEFWTSLVLHRVACAVHDYVTSSSSTCAYLLRFSSCCMDARVPMSVAHGQRGAWQILGLLYELCGVVMCSCENFVVAAGVRTSLDTVPCSCRACALSGACTVRCTSCRLGTASGLPTVNLCAASSWMCSVRCAKCKRSIVSSWVSAALSPGSVSGAGLLLL